MPRRKSSPMQSLPPQPPMTSTTFASLFFTSTPRMAQPTISNPPLVLIDSTDAVASIEQLYPIPTPKEQGRATSKRAKGSSTDGTGKGTSGSNGGGSNGVGVLGSDDEDEGETLVAQRSSRRLAKMATDDDEEEEEGDGTTARAANHGQVDEEVEADDDADGLSELTDLQKLIVSAIVKQGNKATLEEIETEVLKYWSRLRKRDGSKYAYDCKRVVLASLANTSSARPMFQRTDDGSGGEVWALGERSEKWGPILAGFVPGGESADGKSLSVNSNKRGRRGSSRGNGDESSADEGGSGKQSPSGTAKRGGNADATELTELQQLMALTILESDDAQATLEEITARVEPLWGNVHKRDGSVYSGNCERACKASLAYASSAKPLFQRLDAPGYVYALRDEWDLSADNVRAALKAWPWANGETAAEETAATDGDDEGKAGEETDNDGNSGSEDGSSQRTKRQRTSRRSGSSRNTRTRRGT
mmetsp:Transcript_1796/g.5754  ORF Transcript_1796/g.5754 Transcript_1796/m.5754 type:complete len:476 (-) Transcript_1796:31-1458(-)